MTRRSAKQFHDRYFPVRPILEQLKHQAKDLLRAMRQGDAAAVAELHKHHPGEKSEPINSAAAKDGGATNARVALVMQAGCVLTCAVREFHIV